MRHSDINLTMSRYTHIFRGQESDAVAKLPDFSISSSQQQVVTGTDNKPVDVAQSSPEKLTPQLTPTAFPVRNQLAADVNSSSIRPERADNYKPLQGETLCTESRGLSPSVIDKKQIRPTGFEPATSGLGNRCSILLSYGRNILKPQKLGISITCPNFYYYNLDYNRNAVYIIFILVDCLVEVEDISHGKI